GWHRGCIGDRVTCWHCFGAQSEYGLGLCWHEYCNGWGFGNGDTLGPLMQYIFGVELKILPISGWDSFEHMIMPAFALGFAQSAIIARLTRASLLQVLNEDYIRTARAKGLSSRRVIWM